MPATPCGSGTATYFCAPSSPTYSGFSGASLASASDRRTASSSAASSRRLVVTVASRFPNTLVTLTLVSSEAPALVMRLTA